MNLVAPPQAVRTNSDTVAPVKDESLQLLDENALAQVAGGNTNPLYAHG